MLNAVTQVLTTTGECAGAGFAIYPKGMIVTCAHVVNAALGHNATKAEQPTQTVLLTFLGTKQTSSAEIVAWSPYEQHDVAILKIQDELPKQIKPILLFDISDLRDCAFRVYGFPRRVGYTSGRYAQGQLTAFLPTGKLQAHSSELRPGDSGGFVQELQMGRVVGMVSSVDETEATAFIIPAPLIALVCEQVQLNRVLYPFSPLTDGLVGLPGNPLTGVEDFLVEYLGTSTRPAPFGGRQTELDALDTWLADSSKPYALITQPAGRGKSALLTRWIAKVVAEGRSDITFVPISQRFDTALRSRCFSLLGARLRYLCATDTAISLTTAPDLWLSEIDQYLRTDREGERPLLVVLDGLDEAADWEAGHDLRFPQRPGRGVKLIVSARLIHDDQDESGWLRRLRWSRGVQTISVDPLDQVGMADVLQAMGNPLDRLAGQVDIVKELYHLTQGDPLLTRLYVEALLEQGGNAAFLAPKDLQAITPGLSGYFDAWFEAQDRLWRQQGRETLRERAAVMCFLNLLACALGPIEREDVAAIARTPLNEAHRLEDTRRVVARFVLGDGVKRGFVFSHPQLALYFYNQMLATEQNEWHSRFLVYGQQILDKLNKGQTKPQNVSSYIVQYYGAHLEQSEAASDELLYSLVSEGWLRAWEALESVQSGFLHDVDRAWRRAIQKRNIGLQVRCALCHSSIVTLSSNLFTYLVHNCLSRCVCYQLCASITVCTKSTGFIHPK